MAGERPRKHRIVRTALMTVAAVTLLLGWYVSAYCGMYWLSGRGIVSQGQLQTLNATAFAPLAGYGQGEFAGSHTLRVWLHWSMFHGGGSSWTLNEVDDWVTEREQSTVRTISD